jgi:quinoprotein glucose dehydrogenase
MFRRISFLSTLAICSALYLRFTTDTNLDWPEYLGGPDRNHYSPLSQIDTGNVGKLQVAWSYAAPDTGQMQMNPIIIDGVLYGVSSALQAFALDAQTGRELWHFGDPFKSTTSTCRGVTHWTDGKNEARIFYTSGQWLYALDARTGKPVSGFGESGRISLRTGLGPQAKDKFVISNTPGTIFENVIIMPTRLSEGSDAAPGHIQAFDVRTGKLTWVFHTIPHPGEYGYITWPKNSWKNTDVGGANNWAGMAVDRKRGIVYVPTGSAAFDFYGGNRKGSNLFANCLLALNARTGKRIWHYQLVHHDLWDRDFPSPPNLVSIRQKGANGSMKRIDAVAVTTKSGHVLVFDRVTGKSLFPIKEVPVEQSTLPGEATWPTQPMPIGPATFSRQSLTESEINPYSPDRDSLASVFKKIKKGYYAPPNKQGTLVFPGIDGGAEWGGSAVDPDGILYVNANEMAWILTMIDTPKQNELAHLSPGEQVYTLNCSACHGPDRKGNAQSGYPSLVDIQQRRDRDYLRRIVSNGKGMMPGFPTLKPGEKEALIAFLSGDEKHEVTDVAKAGITKKPKLPYKITGYHKFLDSKGYPAITPPWGTLTAIDLNTGKRVWQNIFGEYPELKAKGIPQTGSENYGGPVVTAGGVLFIGATRDGMFRAYNKRNGKLLWEYQLPAAGFATPSTYQIGGKQYVVIACGGTKLGTKKGNQVVAFALP